MIRTFVASFGLFLIASAAPADPPLKVPAGFEVKKVAGPPLVKFPVIGDFDEKGRLYVIDMAGPITHAEVAAKKPAHKIVRLDDTDGDGTFDTATTFADGLPFPEGCMYLNGSVYSACPPHILKLTDTDGDGKADKREVWWDGKTLTGCANDLHGPYRGPDGYVYWTKGAFAKQELTLGNGKKFTTRASHVFRAKPDGSGLEVMMTGGMDNPVGVAFTASGDLIVSNTFLQHPADGKRDGLIHAVPGGVWGKDHDPIYEHPWTSPKTMPVMTHLGPAAPAGIVRYDSGKFGDEYRDNLFCAQFNLRKVSRHVLVPKGSTYETKDSDFVSSDDPDFHPTDVIPAADGSLLVIDTGGWYKLCCPSSQLVKADVFGGIYRVKRTTEPLTYGKPPPRPESHPSPEHELRRWAEKAGPSDVNMILGRTAGPHDQHLDHALTYALIRIGDFDATYRGLTADNPRTRRSALAALEAIDSKRLKPTDVLPHLGGDAELRETAWWVAAKHPEWGGELVGHFRERLAGKLSAADQEDLTNRLAKFAKNEAVQKLLAENATNTLALRAMARANLKAVPAAWADTLPLAVNGNAAEAFAAIRGLPFKSLPKPLADAVAAVATDAKQPADLRLAALGSFPDRADQPELFAFVLAELATDKRAAAADVLSRGSFSPPHLAKLAAALKTVGPVELAKMLPAFAKSADEAVGLALVAALNEPKVRAAVRTEQLKPIVDKYPAAVKAEAAKLYAVLDAEIQKQRDKLDALVKELPAGDVLRGHKVFNSQKAACATCHKIGYVGGTTGPDLTRIGSIRTERDLLEAIVFPSLSFVRSYEPVSVSTLDGRQLNGILKKDAPDEIVLVVAADKEERIARDNVETLKPGTVSIMPAGLDQQLSKQDLADLVAFLRASK